MPLRRSLRRLADSIQKPGPPPATLRYKPGTIVAYTPGATFASVTIDNDTLDAPFVGGVPVVGQFVAVLLAGGSSPVILGPVSAGGGDGITPWGGGLPAYVLALSTTDAAANDAAIDAAIAFFDGRGGIIYAPACPPVGSGTGVWPIAAAHDFVNCDLIGAGAGVYSGGAPPDTGYPVTLFYCATAEAGFDFSGYGSVTGGFQLSGGEVALQPFKRSLTHAGGDIGRLFQNIYVTSNAAPAGVGHQAGIINTWGYVTSITITVVNSGGTETTSALPMPSTTAADLQAAIEALANVGSGNCTVTSRDLVEGTPVGGGPYEFQFSGGGATDSTLSLTYTTALGNGEALVVGPRSADHAMVSLRSYLDTYINFGIAAAAEHGLYLNADNCTFINFTADFANGDIVVLGDVSLVKFVGGDMEVPIGSFIYSDRGDFTVDGMSFYQIFSANTPFLIVYGGRCELSNFYMHGIGGPLSNPGAPGVYLDGAGTASLGGASRLNNFPGALAVITSSGSLLDYKAVFPDGTREVSYLTDATVDLAGGVFHSGVWSDGPVRLLPCATADRPVVAGAGSTVFDTDLIRPIWSDGAGGWVDATGTAV